MEDFIVSLKKLMICEYGYGEDVDILIKKYPYIVIGGIMAGHHALRATVIAILRAEDENGKTNANNH